jgi:hypothetical protein
VLPSGLYKNNGKPTIDRNFFKSRTKTIKVNLDRSSKADADVFDEETCTHYTGSYTSNSCGAKSGLKLRTIGVFGVSEDAHASRRCPNM